MAGLNPEIRNALENESDETWKALTQRLLLYVVYLVRGRRWRGRGNGIPPDGHDPESIVAEAFKELFAGSDWQPSGNPYTPDELQNELRRLAYNIVHRVDRRLENHLTVSGEDFSHSDDELREESFFNNVAGAHPQPDQEALRNEAVGLVKAFQNEFKTFLGIEQRLIAIFDCICKGITKRNDQAGLLNISPQEVTNARKRLDRKLDEFALHAPNYPKPFIRELKNA